MPWLEPDAFSEDRMKLMYPIHVRSEFDAALWAVFDTLLGSASPGLFLRNIMDVVRVREQYLPEPDGGVASAFGVFFWRVCRRNPASARTIVP
jgi:hypothetical protein